MFQYAETDTSSSSKTSSPMWNVTLWLNWNQRNLESYSSFLIPLRCWSVFVKIKKSPHRAYCVWPTVDKVNDQIIRGHYQSLITGLLCHTSMQQGRKLVSNSREFLVKLVGTVLALLYISRQIENSFHFRQQARENCSDKRAEIRAQKLQLRKHTCYFSACKYDF